MGNAATGQPSGALHKLKLDAPATIGAEAFEPRRLMNPKGAGQRKWPGVAAQAHRRMAAWNSENRKVPVVYRQWAGKLRGESCNAYN